MPIAPGCAYYPTPGYVNGELIVHNVTHLDANIIGSDVAAPIDTLAIYCDTTIGSAANGRDLYVFLDPAKQVTIDAFTQPQTQVGGAFYVDVKTLTATGIKGIQADITTGNLINGAWAYGYYANMNVTAAVTATSNVADLYLAAPVGDTANVVTYGLYIEAGFDVGIAVLSPIKLSSLIIAPTADPTPYPLNFELEGWPTAGVYTQGRVINMDYGVARTLDGALYGIYMDFRTNVTLGGQTVTGIYVDIGTVGTANPGTGLNLNKSTTNSTGGAGTASGTIFQVNITDIANGGAGCTVTDTSAGIGITITASDAGGGEVMNVQNSPLSVLYVSAGGTPIMGSMNVMSATIPAGFEVSGASTVKGVYMKFSQVLNNPGANLYGIHIDESAIVETSKLAHYGTFIQMPAAYAGGGVTAAIYATGNGNIYAALIGDGMRITMTEAAATAIKVIMNNTGATTGIDIDLVQKQSGNIMIADFSAAETLTGALTGILMDFTTNVTPAAQIITCMDLALPTNINVASSAIKLTTTQARGMGIDIDFNGVLANPAYMIYMDASGGTNAAAMFTGIYINTNSATMAGAGGQRLIYLTPSSGPGEGIYSLITVVDDDLDCTPFYSVITMVEGGAPIAMAINDPHIYLSSTFTSGANPVTDAGGFITATETMTEGAGAYSKTGFLVSLNLTSGGGSPEIAGTGIELVYTGTINLAGQYVMIDANSSIVGGAVAAAGDFYGVRVVQAGNFTQAVVNSNFYGFATYLAFSFGSGGATGGTLAAFALMSPGTVINGTAVNFYGVDIDTSSITLTNFNAVAGTRMTLAENAVGTNGKTIIAHDVNITGFATGRADIYGMRMVLAGTKNAGDATYGISIAPTMTLSNASEDFFGVAIDLSGATPTNFNSITGTRTVLDEKAVGTNGKIITGHYIDMTGFATGRADLYGIRMVFDGSKTGGDQTVGLSIVPTMTLNNAAETFSATHVDLSGMTLTSALATRGHNIVQPAAGTTGMYLSCDSANVNVTSQLIGFQISAAATAASIAVTGALMSGTYVMTNTAPFNATNSQSMMDISYVLTRDAGANLTWTGSILSFAVTPVNNPQISGNKISQTYTAVLIPNSTAFRGYYIEADFTIGTGGPATVEAYGAHIDFAGSNGVLASIVGFYGLLINMPAPAATVWGANVTAAISATGNGNTVNIIGDQGVRITMNATMQGIYIDQISTPTNEKNLIFEDVDCGAIAGAAYFRGAYFNIDETVVGTNGSFIVGQQIDISGFATGRADIIGLNMILNGTKNAGDATIGIRIAPTITLSHASEDFTGFILDMSGATPTNFNSITGSSIILDEKAVGTDAKIMAAHSIDITGFATGRADLIGLRISFDGTKSGGDVTQGIYITGTMTLNNAAETFYGIDIRLQSLTLTSATAVAGINIVADAAAVCQAIRIDAASEDQAEKNLIFVDVDCAAITGAAYFRGAYFDIDEMVVGNNGSFIVGHEVDLTGFATGRADLCGIRVVFDGSKTGGDQECGVCVRGTMTVNNGAEILRGVEVDLTSFTLTSFAEATAHKITLGSKGQAIYIDQATTATIEKNLIYADINVAAVTGAAYFRGVFLDIDETVVGNNGSFIVGHEIDLTGFATGRADLYGINILIDGSKTGGDATIGIRIAPTITLNNAAEDFTGILMDMSGATPTNFNSITSLSSILDEKAVGTDAKTIIGHSVDITGFATGRADIIGIKAIMDGTKSGGDLTKGLLLDINMTLNNASEVFYGAHIDLDGMTTTLASVVAALLIDIDGITTPNLASYLAGIRVNTALGRAPAIDTSVRGTISGRIEQGAPNFVDHMWAGELSTAWATRVTTGGVTKSNLINGWVTFTTGAVAGNEESVDFDDDFNFESERRPTFEVRVKLSQIDNDTEVYIGLVDTRIAADYENPGTGSEVMLQIDFGAHGSQNWFLIVDNDAVGPTKKDTGIAGSVNEVVLRFEYISDTEVEVFVDGVSKGTCAANVPAGDALQPVISIRTALGGGAAAKAMKVDYIKTWQDQT